MENKKNTIKGKTESGFAFEISEERLENYEIVETLMELEANPMILPKLVSLLLGKEQADALKSHVRDDEGIVSTSKMMDEIKDIFETPTAKNS